MIVQTSPVLGRCHSPLASPLYAPKVSGAGFLWSGGPVAGASPASRYRWEIQHRKAVLGSLNEHPLIMPF